MCGRSPVVTCTCGIYAASSLAATLEVSRTRSHLQLVLGIVQGWGRVVEHDDGWRAEFARPVALLRGTPSVTARLWPPSRRRARLMEALAQAYDVPLIVEHEASEWLGVQPSDS